VMPFGPMQLKAFTCLNLQLPNSNPPAFKRME